MTMIWKNEHRDFVHLLSATVLLALMFQVYFDLEIKLCNHVNVNSSFREHVELHNLFWYSRLFHDSCILPKFRNICIYDIVRICFYYRRRHQDTIHYQESIDEMYAALLFNEVNAHYIDLPVEDGSFITEEVSITPQEDCKDTTEPNIQ